MSGYTPGNGLPIGLPVASSSRPVSAQVSAEWGESRGTNTPGFSSLESRPVSARRLAWIDQHLPPRDRAVLVRIAEHRYLNTRQIQRFEFTDHSSKESARRTANVVCARLEKLGLVRSLQRRVGGFGAGSSAKLLQLAPAGARLLRGDGWPHRTHEPSLRFLLHCLAVADVHLSLRDLTSDGTYERIAVQTEPDSWREFIGVAGERLSLQPDLSATLSTQEYDDRWFIEVDLGTESLPTVLRKCAQYESYRASGQEQSDHGSFPLVLWVLMNDHRAQALRRAVLRNTRLTPALYRFASPETFREVILGVAS